MAPDMDSRNPLRDLEVTGSKARKSVAELVGAYQKTKESEAEREKAQKKLKSDLYYMIERIFNLPPDDLKPLTDLRGASGCYGELATKVITRLFDDTRNSFGRYFPNKDKKGLGNFILISAKDTDQPLTLALQTHLDNDSGRSSIELVLFVQEEGKKEWNYRKHQVKKRTEFFV